ncbi:MAG: hypothetical protein U5R49_23740 [Deltaproteobacteria bacterium]|nr:hypothetical protein [Deltaproteobacteria bacterium]
MDLKCLLMVSRVCLRWMGSDSRMYRFESLIHEAVRFRQSGMPVSKDAVEVSRLYEDRAGGEPVQTALEDPFFPLTLYAKKHLSACESGEAGVARAGRDLALLSGMYLRIRKDIPRYFGNREVTCVDLNGDANQEVHSDDWCSLCGECCQLPGTIPDPPEPIRYPGYWYTYIAGDGPLIQQFCPFLFELPVQSLFFCAIHTIKPLTCLAYGKENCEESHPGMAVSNP